uniref:Uncharacterized protein n=1 Tax=Arundo donax TaxID=35708 RepID=A0A0A9B545_ARUDO
MSGCDLLGRHSVRKGTAHQE